MATKLFVFKSELGKWCEVDFCDPNLTGNKG